MYTLALLLYNIAYPVLFALYYPFYRRHLKKRGNYKEGFGERFGRFTPEKREALAKLTAPVWVHAVSVGETVAALSFIQRWQERDPEQHFVLSTTTSTGQQIARSKAPEGVAVVYFPLDFLPAIGASFRAIRPSKLIIFEVEVWPNIIRAAVRKGLPVYLVNCRMSDNSARGYARYGWFFRRIFDSFEAIAVQTEEDGRRIRQILPGSHKVHVCGTMKFDQVPDCEGADVDALFDRVFPRERLVYVAASTHAPEEAIMARICKSLRAELPQFRMVLVPRHQERADEAQAALDEEGVPHVLITELRGSEGDCQKDVLIVNTTGELMNFLAAADIVYVGKSLGDFANDGGHNIIEPAIFGKPILFGPEMHNFRDVVRIFLEDDSVVQVKDEDALRRAIADLARDEKRREQLSKASRGTVDKRRGAIGKTIDIVTAETTRKIGAS